MITFPGLPLDIWAPLLFFFAAFLPLSTFVQLFLPEKSLGLLGC
jgi:hypothetical protein